MLERGAIKPSLRGRPHLLRGAVPGSARCKFNSWARGPRLLSPNLDRYLPTYIKRTVSKPHPPNLTSAWERQRRPRPPVVRSPWPGRDGSTYRLGTRCWVLTPGKDAISRRAGEEAGPFRTSGQRPPKLRQRGERGVDQYLPTRG